MKLQKTFTAEAQRAQRAAEEFNVFVCDLCVLRVSAVETFSVVVK